MKKFINNSFFLMKLIFRFSPSYLPIVILIALTAFIGPISTVLVPKMITDELLGDRNLQKIITIVIAVVLGNLLRCIAKTIYNERYNPFHQTQIRKNINSLLMDKSQKLDRKYFDDPAFYDKYTRALSQADSGVISFVDNLSNLFDRLVYISTVITIITTLDPLLILFSLACVLVLFFFSGKESKYRYMTDQKITSPNRKSEYAKRIHYLPDHAEDMRTFPLSGFLKTKYWEANCEIQNTVKQRSGFLSFLVITDEGLRAIILQLVTMIYLIFRILNGDLEVSAFIALFMATMQLSYEFFNFVNCFSGFYRLSLYTDDLIDILHSNSEIEESAQPSFSTDTPVYSLDICHAFFHYPGSTENVLKDVDIHLHQGQRVALVGYNGAGKTTLVKLLLRLYDPQNGGIHINGQDIRNFDVSSVRNKIGVVFQNYHCYSMTIAENILMRKMASEKDRSRVIEALKKSNLYEYVMQLPNGIDTMLTREFDNEGILLSGGECQKLALARVFASQDKDILIMDEASGALDPISEHKVNQNIIKFSYGKTLLLISHRLSIVREMDYIYYLDHGSVLEQGTHNELIEKNGRYAEMYNVQAKTYQNI